MTDTIKFIATDMDGTLLDENSNLPPAFPEFFQRLKNENILFAAASGRQYYSLYDTFEGYQDEMLFIAENGTLVMHQGKELYSCTLDSDSVPSIINKARSINDAFIVLCGKKGAYIETQDPTALEEISKYYHRCEYVEDLLTVDDEFIKIAVLNFNGSAEQIEPIIRPAFGDNFQVVVSAKIWLDVMNKVASKGAAIRHLQQTMGFTYEQTMSFGDYFNDAEMLKESYYSYAMENAHPGVKEIARFSAPSNTEFGVISAVYDFLDNQQ
ncbi:HAD family hydrolase [Vibrio sp. SCSIO 43140]|uniref:Cof-type HAD-IIB family hydrolase n=1 Tax=Vibrio sp. SCSIO 43140 TaxID=2819100 RepID=UPI00207500EC|nr:Cof-type HAD-IIB family hydrolase [Vibrio sp. SCSIO 43140]USD59320.1 HAD family hydrolase [Vibrio sp. SCSIO 43140]